MIGSPCAGEEDSSSDLPSLSSHGTQTLPSPLWRFSFRPSRVGGGRCRGEGGVGEWILLPSPCPVHATQVAGTGAPRSRVGLLLHGLAARLAGREGGAAVRLDR